jgi:hypothetical protein
MSASIVKAGERAPLNVLGMPLRFLCDSRETGGAWSLFEEEVPFGMGPMPHRHDWDEAYYILDGEVDFEIDGQLVTSKPGDLPAHASAFFEEVNSEGRSLPEDLAKVPEIGARHGIHFLP